MDLKSATKKWFPNDGDVSYEKRLEVVRELGRQFPGVVLPIGHEFRSLGLFAGIYLQTRWQHDSGRDQISLWFLVNQSLTLAPKAYMHEFLDNPKLKFTESPYVLSHPTRDEKKAPIIQMDTCRAWKNYFASQGSYLNRSRLLWKAHTTSIRHSLWQYQDEFSSVDTSSAELSFWQGWIKLIFSLEKPAPFTNDLFKPILTLLMPKQPLEHLSGLSFQQMFLRLISRNPLPQEQFINIYSRPN